MHQVKIPVWCVGISHRTAPVELIERLSIDEGNLTSGFEELRSRFSRHFPERELVRVSTCNRIELYWSHGVLRYDGGELDNGECPYEGFTTEELEEIFALPADARGSGTKGPIYQLRGIDACRHLFEVACGLDSLVIGEHQVLGQLTEALEAAHAAASDGPVMRALFTSAIRAGRRARSETGIARNGSSMSAVAVELAESLLGSLDTKRAVVAGAGEMGRLAIEALSARGVSDLRLVNRSAESAHEAVFGRGGLAYSLKELPRLLEKADLLITSTAAHAHILDLPTAEGIARARGGKPLLIIDIALPRNVAPEVGRLAGIHLYDMEGLKEIINRNAALRRQEIPRVEGIITEEIAGLAQAIGELAVHPLLAGLWNRAHDIRNELLESARRATPGLSDLEWQKLKELSELLLRKLLHEPATRLREAAGSDAAMDHARSLAFLFGLDGAHPSAGTRVEAQGIESGSKDGLG